MAEFAYNKAKNASFGLTPFELNYGYHPQMFYKKNVKLCSKFKSANKLLTEPKELMIVCQKNFYHTQEF